MWIACSRALVTVFWLATSIYALLCAIPFASEQFIQPGLVPAVTAFAAWHHAVSAAVLAIAIVAFARTGNIRRRSTSAFLGLWGATILLSIATSGLPGLRPSAIALAVSIGALLFPIWLAAVDLGAGQERSTPTDASALAEFLACMAAATIVVFAHAAGSLFGGSEIARAALADVPQRLLLHLVVFAGLFAVVSVIRGLGRFTLYPHVVEAVLSRVAVAGLVAAFVHSVLLPSLSFTGVRSIAVSVALGATLALALGPRGTSAPPGLASGIAGLTPRWATRSVWRAAGWLALAMGALTAGERAIAATDWNFAVGKLLALTSWLIALAAAIRVAPQVSASRRWSSATATAAPFAACLLVLALQQFVDTRVSAATVAGDNPRQAAGSDVSTRLITDVLAAAPPADDALYEYLQRNTNIPHSVKVAPVPVDFSPLTGATPERPHVFLFVVDSLRRDYLSPYNSRVGFTPAIGRFAAESTVFERAFTRYGATGLSVPSIWVGGFVLHKQYVTPFAPMNTLTKLLDAQGYQQWVSVDNIVETIAPATAARTPLDSRITVKDYRFCTTLAEVRGRLDSLTPDRPTFVYSLPQDIHVSAITREGSRAIDGQAYEGFNESYASRVRRLDECFGGFIDDLKTRGLYDNSVVILTADHGDSLGEEGRMGHAYTIFPEIVQIPLMVHLPARLRTEFVADTAAPAFTSDITPSLYALFGHSPARPAPIFGQPLFRRAAERPVQRESAEVVASSYGSVYGALLNDARRLYIIDAVSLREHAYELDGTGAGRRITVRPADREAGQRAIRSTIDGIAAFYKYVAR